MSKQELKPPADLVQAIQQSGDMTAPDAQGNDYSINTPHAIRAKLEHERPPTHAASDAAVDGSSTDEAVTLSPEPSHFEKHARKVVDHEKEIRHAHDKEVSHTHRRGAANKSDPTQAAGTQSGRESYKTSHHGAHETSAAMPHHQ